MIFPTVMSPQPMATYRSSGVAEIERLRQLIRLHIQAQAAKLAFEDVLALGQVLLAVLPFEPGANLRPGALGLHQSQVDIEPVAAGAAVLGGEDFNLVAGFQLVIQGDQLAVDFRAAAAMADLGVDMVGKIDRGGTLRQVDDIAARGEDIDAVLEYVRLHAVHELRRVGDFLAPIHQPAQRVDALLVAFVDAAAFFFVAPVRGDAIFGVLVHLGGADLHLERFSIVINDGGMQGLVIIVLGGGDVIVKFVRDGPPVGVDDPQGGVTVLLCLATIRRTPRKSISISKGRPFSCILLINRIDVLGTPGDLCLDAGLVPGWYSAGR